MNRTYKRIIIVLLIILNVLFTIYYLILGYYARLHFDDLHFFWKLKEMTIAQYVDFFYFDRSGRFIGYFLNGVLYKTAIFLNEYRFFPILFGATGVLICWRIIKNLSINISSALIFNSIILFYYIYILTNIDFPVFYWLCALSYYLFAPMMLYLIVVINKKNISTFQWIILIIISVILGGGQEAFTPIMIIALLCCLIYYLYKNNYNFSQTWKEKKVKRIFILSSIILLCFTIVIIAPGNYKRLSDTSEFKQPDTILAFIKALFSAVSTFFYFMIYYIPYYSVIFSIFIYIGSRTEVDFLSRQHLIFKKITILAVSIYVLIVLLIAFPSAYLWGGFGIQRNYTPAVFFTLVFISFQGFILGYYKFKNRNVNSLLLFSIIGILTMLVIMCLNMKMDTVSAKNYAESYDNRLKYVTKLNNAGRRDTVEVAPLNIPYTKDTKWEINQAIGIKSNPQPVLYYISDTEKVPNEHAYHYKKAYELNFLIKLKEE